MGETAHVFIASDAVTTVWVKHRVPDYAFNLRMQQSPPRRRIHHVGSRLARPRLCLLMVDPIPISGATLMRVQY